MPSPRTGQKVPPTRDRRCLPPGTNLSAIPPVLLAISSTAEWSSQPVTLHLAAPVEMLPPRYGRHLRRVGLVAVGVPVVAPVLPGHLVEHDAQNRGAGLVQAFGGAVQVSLTSLAGRREHQGGIGVPGQDGGVGDRENRRTVDEDKIEVGSQLREDLCRV